MTSPELLLKKYTSQYDTFEDGRINYTNKKDCVVLNSVIRFGTELLLIQRSGSVGTYPNTWSGVSGYIDTDAFVEELMMQELEEELKITNEAVHALTVGPVLTQEDAQIGKVWHVFPVLVELSTKPKICLNWETSTFAWFSAEQLPLLELLPGYNEVLSAIANIRV